MVSLLDIAEVKASATIRGVALDVRGILAEHLAFLYHRYPELRKLVTGKGDADTAQTLISQAPMAVADVIAIGTGAEPGTPNFEQHVAVAAKLAVGEQLHVLQKIWEVTFPQGGKSFMDGVAAAVGLPPVAVGWAPDTKSPQQSQDASSQDEANANVGEAHPVSSQVG